MRRHASSYSIRRASVASSWTAAMSRGCSTTTATAGATTRASSSCCSPSSSGTGGSLPFPSVEVLSEQPVLEKGDPSGERIPDPLGSLRSTVHVLRQRLEHKPGVEAVNEVRAAALAVGPAPIAALRREHGFDALVGICHQHVVAE